MSSQLVTLVLTGKQLVPATPEDTKKLNAYIATLQPEQRVEMFVSDIADVTRSRAQLAYFHVVLRHLAQESGQDEAEIKVYVKNQIGFVEASDSGVKLRSLASATKEEMELAINVVLAIADTLGIRLPAPPTPTASPSGAGTPGVTSVS